MITFIPFDDVFYRDVPAAAHKSHIVADFQASVRAILEHPDALLLDFTSDRPRFLPAKDLLTARCHDFLFPTAAMAGAGTDMYLVLPSCTQDEIQIEIMKHAEKHSRKTVRLLRKIFNLQKHPAVLLRSAFYNRSIEATAAMLGATIVWGSEDANGVKVVSHNKKYGHLVQYLVNKDNLGDPGLA